MVPFLYIGDDLCAIRGPQQMFRDAKGKMMRFSGVRGLWAGDSYMIDVANGTIKTRPEPVYGTKLEMSKQEWERHEGTKLAIKHYRERRCKAMELKKPHRDIVAAIKLLKPFARDMDSLTLSRFTGYIQNELSKKK